VLHCARQSVSNGFREIKENNVACYIPNIVCCFLYAYYIVWLCPSVSWLQRLGLLIAWKGSRRNWYENRCIQNCINTVFPSGTVT